MQFITRAGVRSRAQITRCLQSVSAPKARMAAAATSVDSHQHLQQLCEAAGQQHLLEDWASLTTSEQQQLADDIQVSTWAVFVQGTPCKTHAHNTRRHAGSCHTQHALCLHTQVTPPRFDLCQTGPHCHSALRRAWTSNSSRKRCKPAKQQQLPCTQSASRSQTQ